MRRRPLHLLKQPGSTRNGSALPAWQGGGQSSANRFSLERLLLVLVFALASPYSARAAQQGHPIVNVAGVSAFGLPQPLSSSPASVQIRIESQAQIELFQYAPVASSAIKEAVALGAYRKGSDTTDQLIALTAPLATGATTPIDLSRPVPLLRTSQLHAGDPLFIRVTDTDQNADWTVRDTVFVTVTDDVTGDTEVVRLTEDSTDTGVFIGYIPTRLPPLGESAASSAHSYEGILEVQSQSTVTARYADPEEPSDVVSAPAIVDPTTLVFDSHTGKPIDGAQITLIDVSTGQPAQVLGDDGFSTFPSTVVSGAQTKDSSGHVYQAVSGALRFPWVKAGSYRYAILAPPGYAAPSTVPDGLLKDLPGGPFVVASPGSRGEPFLVDAGPGFRIDVPLDPGAAQLWVQKTAAKDVVGTGDFLPYEITVTNMSSSVSAGNAQAIDTLPVGFRYQAGSTTINGQRAPDPTQTSDGRGLTFNLGTIPAGATVTIQIVVQVGAGAAIGQTAINLASAKADGGATSNVARAVVKVGDDFLTTHSVLVGRVTTGECGPPPAVAPPPEAPAPAPPPPPQPRPPGQFGLQLHQTTGETSASYDVDLWGQAAPLHDFQVVVALPRGLNFEPGSATIDGANLTDPELVDAGLRFRLPDQPEQNWKSRLSFRAYLAAGAKLGSRSVSATANGLGPTGARATTDKSEASLMLIPRVNHRAMSLTIRPHFASFGTDLGAADRKELDRIAVQLRKAHVDRISVIGHTDSDPIKGAKAHKKFADNTALSQARAQSVGEYLIKALHFPADKITFDGRGEAEPIADNETADGRAMNRRVEVHARAAEQTSEMILSEGEVPLLPGRTTAEVAALPVEAPRSPPSAPASTVADSAGAQRSSGSPLMSGGLLGSSTVVPGATIPGALEGGVPGVRIFMEDGTLVVTDKRGMFHFEGVTPGRHVVQLDLASLPPGYEAISCHQNDRFAGRAFSQFVDISGGVLWRADFLVHPKPVPPPPPKPPPPPVAAPEKPLPGELAMILAQTIDGLSEAYTLEVMGERADLKDVQVAVELPEGATYQEGSATIDGEASAAKLEGSTLTFLVGDQSHDWKHQLGFRLAVPEGARQGTKVVTARASGTDPTGTRRMTPPGENVFRVGREGSTKPKKLVIRPHFPSLGVSLAEEDRQQLDTMAAYLKSLNVEKIVVTGYTDSDKIKGRGLKQFKDNKALSLARASTIGRYLMDALNFPPDQIEFVGKGEENPIDDNSTAEGRARNRRVEVEASAAQTITHTTVVSLSDSSGLQKVSTENAVATSSVPSTDGGGTSAASATTTATDMSSVTTVVLSHPTSAAESTPATTTGSTAPAPTTGQAPPAVPAPPQDGVLSPLDGEYLAERINAVQLRLKSYLTPKLIVDGTEIAADRIGYRSEDPTTGKTTYTYVGIDFGEKGEHILRASGTDPFGNDRNKQTIKVIRTGDIASMQLISSEGNIADGRTPVRLRLELRDAAGDVIHGSARLEIREGTLTPPHKQDANETLEEAAAGRALMVDKDGWVTFAPVNTSGSYHVLLAAGGAVLPVDFWVKPEMRDWILVGLAEGTVGYDIVKGNMESLKANDTPDKLYADGRIAFYGKGTIRGQWLLTVAYDTRQPTGNDANSLFQVIDPQAYFTLYGDATQQQYDAPSARKIYVKIERDQFYALFGDFDSGLTVTELSRYARRMNGLKTELQTNMFEVNAFGTQSDHVFTQDRIQGDGTSGLYHLTKKNITLNSETVTIEVRDRFRSEVVVSTRTLTRFIDYSIDYDAGTIFFREPIPSRDDSFNPVMIVVEYENQLTGKLDFTYGGRAGIKLFDQRLKVGVTGIHEGQDSEQNNLVGGDVKLQILQNLQLRGEFAWSRSTAPSVIASGKAWLGELAYTSRNFDAKLYYRQQEHGFGLGQQPATEAGTRKIGAEAAWRFGERLSLTGQTYDQYVFFSQSERLLGEARLNYAPRIWGGYIGVREVLDRLSEGAIQQAGQVTAGLKWLTLSERLIFSVDHAQTLWGNGNTDFPTRTILGVEYKVLPRLSVFAAQELTWGTSLMLDTRVGLRSNVWKGGSLTTSVDRQMDESASRLFGNLGLRQTWQLGDAWKVSAGAERTQTFNQVGTFKFNPNTPLVSGATEDFTALSAGGSYQVKGFVWDTRAETRLAKSLNKWGFISGAVGELGKGWAWLARLQYIGTQAPGPQRGDTGSGRIGFVYRPAQSNWVVLNRLDLILDKQTGTETATDSWRVVENVLANWTPIQPVQVSIGYGGKFAHDNVSGRVYEGYTDQVTTEARVDVTERVDIGLRGSVLHTWRGGQLSGSAGPSVGVSVVDNTWIGLGWNIWGYNDPDLSASNYTAQGPYVRLQVKFDQLTVPGVAAWLNKQ